MKLNFLSKLIGVALLAVLVAYVPASAQQAAELPEKVTVHRVDQGIMAAEDVSGVPGSPSARTSINGEQLPAPPQKFKGVIKNEASKSKPYWPARIVPPKGAPNVLVIMTDDSGYGVPSTFGGVIPTPALDKIAKAGLRYTNFHSTALCSPTRAALITGRNHHSVGFGVIAEQATGYPGYDSFIEKDKQQSARSLRTMDTARPGSARTTTRPRSRRAPTGLSTSGPSAWGSSTSTASWEATPISGSLPILYATRRTSTPLSAILVTTSPPPWPMRPSPT